MTMTIDLKIQELISNLKEISREKNLKTGFIIGNTAKKNNNSESFTTPVRVYSNIVVAGVIIYSDSDIPKVCKLLDGKLDYIFVDAEKKIPNVSNPNETVNIERKARELIKKSIFLTYKGNDLTVESVDIHLSYIFKENVRGIGGKNISVIGAGNLGSKLALKLAERGANVILFRRNKKKLNSIIEALNYIKPKETESKIYASGSINEAIKLSDIVLVTADNSNVISKESIKFIQPHTIFFDIGKGTIAPEVISFLTNNNNSFFRADVSSAMAGMLESNLMLDEVLTNRFGRRNFHGIPIVSGGLIGKSGEFIVDNVNAPKVIYGIAAGDGLFKEKISRDDQIVFDTLKSLIAKNVKE